MGIGSSLSSALGATSNVINQRQPSQAAPQPMGGKGAFAAGQQQPSQAAPQPMGGKGAMQQPSQAQTGSRAEYLPMYNDQGVDQFGFNRSGVNPAADAQRQLDSQRMSQMQQGPGAALAQQAFQRMQPPMQRQMQQPSLNPFNQPQFQGQQNPYAAPTPPGTIGHFGIDQYGRGVGQGFGGPPPNQGGMPSPFNPYAAPAQQPMFDQFTTQAEFDRARGMTSTPTPPKQVQPQQPQFNPMMEDLTGQQAIRQQQMMNRMYGMGGKGGGFGGRFGGLGGFNPYTQAFFKDGGKVKK